MALNQLSGGNFRDFLGKPLSNGTLQFELSHDEQEIATPSQVCGGLKKTIYLDNTGNVAAGQFIEANDTMVPAGSYYIVNAFDYTGLRAWKDSQFVTVTSYPSPYNLSGITPTNPSQGLSGGSPSLLLQTNGINNPNQLKLNTYSSDNSVTITVDPTGDLNFQTSSSGSQAAAIGYVIDGGGSVVSTGIKGQVVIPVACTITGWVLTADQTGSAVVAVSAGTYSSFPTLSLINGSDPPTLAGVQKKENLSVSAWTTSLAAGSQLQFNVTSAATVTRLNLTILVTR